MQALASVGAEVPPHDIELDFLVHNVQSGSIIAIPRSSRELEALCDACCAALRRHGIVPAHATRQPHITLAYLPRGSATPAALPGIDVTGISLAVTHFELLHNPGGRYDSLARWPLAGAPLAPLPQQTMLF